MSFVKKLNALKIRLEKSKKLQDYFYENFNKPLSIKRVFKNRVEIGLSDLPILLITRPRRDTLFAGNISNKEHSVLLRIGFNQNDFEKAQDNLIEIEEIIEEIIPMKTTDPDDVAMAMSVGETLNDEGVYHPVYFMMMHLIVKDK